MGLRSRHGCDSEGSGTVVDGIVAVVLDRVPQSTGSAAIGPTSISTVEMLVPVPSVTW